MRSELEVLESIESATKAMLMLQLEAAGRADRAKASGSLEGLLFRAGFTVQAEIVAITGTPRSTVSARLKEEELT